MSAVSTITTPTENGYYWCVDKESDSWLVVYVVAGEFVLEVGEEKRFKIEDYKDYRGPLQNPDMEVSDE